MKKLIDHVEMLFDHDHHHKPIATPMLAEPIGRTGPEVHTGAAPELQVTAAADLGPAPTDLQAPSTVVEDAITPSLIITGTPFLVILGTPGDDTRTGTAADDMMFGLDGNDILRGAGGNDTLDGGKGGDLLDGGDGFDIVSYASAQPEIAPFPNIGVRVNLLDPSQNIGEARGDSFVSIEQFHLSGFADIFVGAGGNDNVFGANGNDDLQGGAGNDILDGGADNDELDGGAGADTILGGGGNDNIRIHLNDSAPDEMIDGGAGFDTLVLDVNNTVLSSTLLNMEQLLIRGNGMNAVLGSEQLAAFNTITNQDGSGAAFSITGQTAGTYSLAGKTITGVLTLNGSSLNDTLIGSSGNDILAGRGGADVIQAGDGNDTVLINANEVPAGESIDGGAGFDKLVVGNSNMHPGANISNMEELDLASGVRDVFLTSVQLADFDVIRHLDGSGAAFSITAQSAGTYSLAGKTIDGILTLNGTSGADTLIGSAGNDILSGKGGADIIQAGDGNDSILINANEVFAGETLDGGNGFDKLVVGDNNMHPFRAAIINMEELFLNSGVQNVFLTSEQLADFDTITHQNGSGAVFNITAETAGAYSLAGKTITGILTLNGSAGADILIGSAGNDSLSGGTGSDILVGGLGADALGGGQGVDTFRYFAVGESSGAVVNGVTQADTITDFTQGEDKVDLSAIDANGTVAGDQAFTFLDNPAGHTGDWTGFVWSVTDASGTTTIFASTDADGDAEMQIHLPQPIQLHASDFIL